MKKIIENIKANIKERKRIKAEKKRIEKYNQLQLELLMRIENVKMLQREHKIQGERLYNQIMKELIIEKSKSNN